MLIRNLCKKCYICRFHRDVRIRIALRLRFQETQINAYPDLEYYEQYIELKNLEMVHYEKKTINSKL
jgi:hypothetical protein